jgi:hypothetical protein
LACKSTHDTGKCQKLNKWDEWRGAARVQVGKKVEECLRPDLVNPVGKRYPRFRLLALTTIRIVRDKPKVPRINGRDKWAFSMDWVATTQVAAAACVLAVVLLALLRRNPQQDVKLPITLGVIQDTRIVADHALQTKWGGEVTWKAEYRVTYSVASREYAVWADSGIRAESEDGVRLAVARLRPSCRVRYKPEDPGLSVADCR